MQREKLFALAKEAEFVCVDSCCSVPNKACSNDVWKGDIVAFVAAIERALLAAPAAPAPTMTDAMRTFIEGMSVSVDVSTGEHDAGNRYYGLVTEVMDDPDDKHGVTLLVQGDVRPNFKPAAQARGPVAHVPVHPRNGPLWADTIPAGSNFQRSEHYPRMALYAAAPAPSAQAALTENDLIEIGRTHNIHPDSALSFAREIAARQHQSGEAGAEAKADQMADRQYRAGFLAGWNAGADGDTDKLRGVQNRVGPLSAYIAAPAPAAQADDNREACSSCGLMMGESRRLAAARQHQSDEAAVNTPPCKGLNCGATDGISHSLECQAEHAAGIVSGGSSNEQIARASQEPE